MRSPHRRFLVITDRFPFALAVGIYGFDVKNVCSYSKMVITDRFPFAFAVGIYGFDVKNVCSYSKMVITDRFPFALTFRTEKKQEKLKNYYRKIISSPRQLPVRGALNAWPSTLYYFSLPIFYHTPVLFSIVFGKYIFINNLQTGNRFSTNKRI